jgi:hypothetical protein
MQPLRNAQTAFLLAGALHLAAPGLGLGLGLGMGSMFGGMMVGMGSVHAAPATGSVHVPVPHQVHARIAPLKRDATDLIPFWTAPFPYDGTIANTDRPFWNAEEEGRRAHKTPFGRVYFEDETYSDNRVLLHIPKGFDVRKPSVMIVFFHGHGATLTRDVLRRQRVPAQITASGVNAVLVAPQLAVNARDSSAGKFWRPGAFAEFIGEAGQALAELHGDPRSVRTFASMPVVIVAYSGGYLPAAWSVSKGGLGRRVRGLVLMDALYDKIDTFASWIARDRSAFFVSTYLGSTRAKNAELVRVLAEHSVGFATELEPKLKPGSVTIIPGGPDDEVNHRDLVTHAWTDYPIADLLRRLRGYNR